MFCKLIKRGLIWSSLISTMPSFAGSISGGGGNTLPNNPIGEQKVTDYLQEARNDVYMFFQTIYQNKYYDPEWANSRLFTGNKTIFDVINGTQIWVKKSGACKSSTGEEVDASVQSPFSDSVCFSPSRLGKKLDVLTFHSEMVALLAHEYSHFLGFNESEAVEFQKKILNIMHEIPNDWYRTYGNSENPFKRVTQSYSELYGRMSAATETLALGYSTSQYTWANVCDTMTEIFRLQEFVNEQFFDKWRLSPTFGNEKNILDNIDEKATGLLAASCGRIENPNVQQKDNFLRYINVFGANTKLSTNDFYQKFHPIFSGNFTILNPITMRRIDTLDDAYIEAHYLEMRYKQILAHVESMMGYRVNEF